MTAPSSLWLSGQPLVLASGSAIRRAMLEAAGIPVEVARATIDERALEEAARNRGADAAAVAAELARAKALDVARRLPGRIVLAADQTLDLDGEALHKPPDLAAAKRQLRLLSGRSHVLHAAAAIATTGDVVFEATNAATLAMRPLSDAMIERYAQAAGPAILDSVGAYQLEGVGIHLFDTIAGDHFTILGLPLLAVLAGLRQLGAVAN